MEEAPTPPLISVLIVSHNESAALHRCLEALDCSRDRAKMEILVVDNGSRDGSAQIDADFPKITVLRLPRNFGATKALNIGIRSAAGDYILLLEPTVEVLPDTAFLLAARLELDSAAIAVCPFLTSQDGTPVNPVRALPTARTLFADWRKDAVDDEIRTNGNPLPNDNADSVPVSYPSRRALMVRRHFLKGMNYLDQRYGNYGGDAELAFQIARASKKILLLHAARATDRSSRDRAVADDRVRAAHSVDFALGASAYVSKHYGWLAGMGFRLKAILHVFAQLLLLRNPGYQFARLAALITGQKIDGSQSLP